MTQRISVHGLQVAENLYRFIEDQVLPGTGVDAAAFWQGFGAIVADLAPKNAALLAERDRLQAELDTWHKAHPGPIQDMAGYRKFLETIGYLVPQPANAQATTTNVDAELATQAGPQLVVPILNARYALNAANARWGSLYDALYGTDVIDEADGAEKGRGYNPKRGEKVIAFARDFLDQAAPLEGYSHKDATVYYVQDGELLVKVDACAVCGSDMKAYKSGNPRMRPPIVMGHEFAGVIVDTRAGKGFKTGERVVMATSVACGACAYCLRGWRNLYANIRPMGFGYNGGMAEYVAIPELAVRGGHVVAVPADVEPLHAALAEPVSCAVNSCENSGVQSKQNF